MTRFINRTSRISLLTGLSAAALFLATAAHAASSTIQIEKITLADTSNERLEIHPVSHGTCDVFTISASRDQFDNMSKIVLAGYLSGKDLFLGHNNADGNNECAVYTVGLRNP